MGQVKLFSLLLLILLLPAGTFANQEQLVAGASSSTEVAKLFFQHFGQLPVCKDYNFSIMKTSIKHRGGVLTTDKFLFGRTGRPLDAEEKALGKEEILLGQVPIVFAAGLEAEADAITLEQLEKIFSRKITNWKAVRGNDAQILLVGREETEPLFAVLKGKYPFFNRVTFDLTFTRSHEVVKFLNSPAGSHAIAFGVKPNFQLYNLLPVEGFSAGLPLGLAYDSGSRNHPVIKAAIAYAASSEWQELRKSLDMLPLE